MRVTLKATLGVLMTGTLLLPAAAFAQSDYNPSMGYVGSPEYQAQQNELAGPEAVQELQNQNELLQEQADAPWMPWNQPAPGDVDNLDGWSTSQ